MKDRTVLITGGAGFIGSSLAVSFKRKYPKCRVIALDNLKRRGSEMNIVCLKDNGAVFVHGDIRVPEDLNLEEKIDLLIDCSAEPSVLAGYGEDPRYVINTNLTGTVNCLELARRDKADVVFLSTSRVYPYEAINKIKRQELKTRFEWQASQEIAGWSEEGIDTDFTKEGPKSFYGATKLSVELILQEYISAYGMRGVINRCGVIAGPGQFGKADQGVFTFWMLAHYFKKKIKYIGFGAGGKQVRDLLHIDDLFELIDLQVCLIDKVNGGVYNVGGGRKASLSLFEATQACRQITGNSPAIGRELKGRKGDIAIYLTDNTRVSRDFNWKPKRTPSRILQDTYEWIRRNEARLKTAL